MSKNADDSTQGSTPEQVPAEQLSENSASTAQPVQPEPSLAAAPPAAPTLQVPTTQVPTGQVPTTQVPDLTLAPAPVATVAQPLARRKGLLILIAVLSGVLLLGVGFGTGWAASSVLRSHSQTGPGQWQGDDSGNGAPSGGFPGGQQGGQGGSTDGGGGPRGGSTDNGGSTDDGGSTDNGSTDDGTSDDSGS